MPKAAYSFVSEGRQHNFIKGESRRWASQPVVKALEDRLLTRAAQ